MVKNLQEHCKICRSKRWYISNRTNKNKFNFRHILVRLKNEKEKIYLKASKEKELITSEEWRLDWLLTSYLKEQMSADCKKHPDRKSLSSWISIPWKAVFQEQIGNLGSPCDSVVKNLPANAGDTGDSDSISGRRRLPGVGNSNPLQDSFQENSMDRGAWWATVRGVTKSQSWLSSLAHMHRGNKDAVRQNEQFSVFIT